ncbi:hypothetical protein K474DRAFT_1656547 [Panus rudis PR-1116 ss-1]|nr:hypothetical protein K474DRAFT_1656547 [Panus rudis PR-1116 ss-1]
MASSEGDPPTNILDHIVYLAAPEKLQDTIEEWRKQGYTVIPGGTHADGLTENALVALKDGIYIELISFVHSIEHYPPGSPSRIARENHTWAKKLPNGYIDYAFLGNNGWPSIAESINRRAEERKEGSAGREVRYEKESKGGRTRLDGVKLEWVISARKAFGEGKEDVIGRLPFFCGDVTPRELRVRDTSTYRARRCIIDSEPAWFRCRTNQTK